MKSYIARDISVKRVSAFQVTGDIDLMCRKVNTESGINAKLYHYGSSMILVRNRDKVSAEIVDVNIGDWIMIGGKGHVSVWPPEEFAERYTGESITISAA